MFLIFTDVEVRNEHCNILEGSIELISVRGEYLFARCVFKKLIVKNNKVNTIIFFDCIS